MNNRENKIDKKYYLVSLSDGTKSMVSDEVVNLKLAFNQLLQVHAIEENGELRTLIGNMKILDVNKISICISICFSFIKVYAQFKIL